MPESGPMPEWTSYGIGSCRLRRHGRLTSQWGAPPLRDLAFVVLDLLLVTTQLVLDLVNALVHRRLGGGTGLTGDKIVLVFRRHQDLHIPALLPLVDGHLDGHQSSKILAQFLSLIVQVLLLLRAQAAVTRRDLDMHSCAP